MYGDVDIQETEEIESEENSGEVVAANLVCNAVCPRYCHLDVVEAISNGHIFNNITRMNDV